MKLDVTFHFYIKIRHQQTIHLNAGRRLPTQSWHLGILSSIGFIEMFQYFNIGGTSYSFHVQEGKKALIGCVWILLHFISYLKLRTFQRHYGRKLILARPTIIWNKIYTIYFSKMSKMSSSKCRFDTTSTF